MPRPLSALLFALTLALSGIALSGPAWAASIDPFVGKYEGTAVLADSEEMGKRDLNFVIKKIDNGFSVDWTTIIHEKGDETERRQFKIVFHKTERPKVFSAAMRRNAFGAEVPLDPMKGTPYFWASIKGDTLFVHGIHVTEDGGYELQVYERTLTEDGMKLRFKRIRNGKFLKDITGTAKRIK